MFVFLFLLPPSASPFKKVLNRSVSVISSQSEIEIHDKLLKDIRMIK
jgi:P2-related tail formation protein